MRRVMGAVLAAVLTAACNSTTRLDNRQDGGRLVESGGSDSAAVESSGDGGTVDAAGGDATTSSGSGAGRRQGSASSGSAAGGVDGGGRTGSGLPAVTSRTQGVTKDTVTIGLRYYDEAGMAAFAAAYGIRGTLPRPRAYYDALIADLNKRGGLAGRRVVPVGHAVDATRSATQVDATNQEACSALTEDNTVFAVVTNMPGGVGETFTGCLAKKNTPLVTDPLVYIDREFVDKYAEYLYLPAAVQSTRMSAFWIDRLAATGFFKGAKLGLLWYDDANGIYRRTVQQGLLPALARHGVKVAEEFVLSSYTDSSQYSSAALRFKTANVTHVLLTDVSSLVSFFFMAAADGQAFYPRYGLNSTSAFAFLEQNAPDSQAVNVVGVGWMPAIDVARPGPGLFDGPEDRCLDLLRSAGIAVDGPYAVMLAFWSCDELWFLEAALAAAPTLDPAGLRAGAESLTNRYQAPGTYRTLLGPGRHDGVAAVRDVAYDSGCACYVYRSAPVDVG